MRPESPRFATFDDARWSAASERSTASTLTRGRLRARAQAMEDVRNVTNPDPFRLF
jgi:hypothetical protein